MALRKEEFHDDPYAKRSVEQIPSAKRQHITIDISAELSERIQAVAHQQSLTVDQYIEHLLNEAISAQHAAPQEWKPVSREGVEQLMRVRNQILQAHGGKPFENTLELLYEAREERDKELGV